MKDVDLERGVVTVRAGKGDKDRETLIPNCLKGALSQKIDESRHYWEEGRSNGVAGVALGGVGRQDVVLRRETWLVLAVLCGGRKSISERDLIDRAFVR